ncbi:MAG: hypothetical protein JWN85_1655 [Gammaproteobacteria bacterium]|nr:hypothetical protein [Gammaproteobacteria bacterium]
MNKILCAALFCACAAPAIAADVGVSISIGQPGFYGQIDIGNVPRPQLVYTQPVVIRRAPEFDSAPPIYLHVPPGHEKHWSKHCAQYSACGRPVYFVRDDWYNNEYVPRYQHGGGDRGDGHGHGHGRGHDKDHDMGHGHDEEHGHKDK